MLFRHGWLHSMNDSPPTIANYPKSIADVGHTENATGTNARYSPYNTTEAKLQTFSPTNVAKPLLADKIKKFHQSNN